MTLTPDDVERGAKITKFEPKPNGGGNSGAKMYGRFKVFTLGDESPSIERPYLMKGSIYKGDLIFIIGDPGSGKTTLAQYLSLGIAQGRSMFGRKVRQGRVLYLAFEGKDLFLLKMSALEKRFGSSRNIVYATQSMQLLQNAPRGDDANRLLEIIKAERIDMVVCDTWSKMLASADDNMHSVASGLISVFDRIREETGAAVMVIAHPNKTDKNNPGGSYTTTKDSDAVIKITVVEDLRTAEAIKLRFDKIGPLYSFRLNRVVLGIDSDGDEISSVDIEEVENDPSATDATKKKRSETLSKGAKEASKWLHEAINDLGQVGVYGTLASARSVTENEWKIISKKRAHQRSDEARRKQIDRAFTELVAANKIASSDGRIWRTD